MEWSLLHPSTQGATSWVPQWVCRSCGASTSLLDIPPLDAASCYLCSTSSAIVFDRPSGRAVRFCVPCLRVVPHDSSVANRVVSSPPSSADPPDWFLHGPLSCFDSLYGWGSSRPSPPGSGTQSWLFCPLISLGLAVAESNRGIPPYSTGSCEQVPPEQSLFCSTNAPHIIQAYATVNNPPQLRSNRGKRAFEHCCPGTRDSSGHSLHDVCVIL